MIKQEIVNKKNSALAIWSLVLGLLFWMPLFNVFFSPLAVYLGIRALIKIKNEPIKYGGKWQAIIGIILGSAMIVMVLVGLFLCLSEIFYKTGFEQVCIDLKLGAFLK